MKQDLFTVLKIPEGLYRFLPIRVILRKGEDGTLRGVTEESFSMGEETNRVNIWWSGKAYSIIGEHQLDAVKDAQSNARPNDLVIDPLAENSPIEIDWVRWLAATTKYDKRNAYFKLKGDLS